MDDAAVLQHIARLQRTVRTAESQGIALVGAKVQIIEFLREFAGPKSAFVTTAQTASGVTTHMAGVLWSVLEGFKAHIEAGLHGVIAPARRAQLDVVSDFLEQAQILLEGKSVHPAAPIFLVGATLEEFLRTWVEAHGLTLGQRKPSLDSYAQVLLAEELITKQDMKDITAWGGLRNHAAHGEWGEVSDKQRAAIMLEGVNLFMRKYGAK